MADDFRDRLAAALRREIAGFQQLQSVDRLSGGASQETYRVVIDTQDGPHAFALRRTPGGYPSPRAPAAPGLETEARLMQAAAAAGVPVPAVPYIFAPDDGLGPAFLMEWRDGETLGARVARAPEFETARDSLAFECGRILARIHGIDLAAAGLEPLLDPITPEAFVRQTWERYQAFGTPQPMIDYTARWLLDHLPLEHRMTLVHNDFRNGNLMVDPARGVVAVLDWEMAHIGDPMRDLGWICTSSWRFGRPERPVGGFGSYDELIRGYESVTGTPVDPAHVRFWEIFGSFWWAVGCLTMANLYRHGPDGSVERAAIGRRSSECQVDCANLLIPGPVTLVSVAPTDDLTVPRADELVQSVRNYLRNDVMTATQGRASFLARVGANSLDIVARELTYGASARAEELAGLQRLFGATADLTTLRWRLVRGLRDGSIALDRHGLAEHLRHTVANQVAIDQPKYPGLRIALGDAAGMLDQRVPPSW
jgi:aminoglycoside phosphotransferase (APT) family kinase protein